MVEMNETASILNNISERSLVLLDEIGRGTSTYDGISIAWAISEYLHEHTARAKTLFATHYHELNEMSETFSRIKNFNVAVKELKNNVLFLSKLLTKIKSILQKFIYFYTKIYSFLYKSLFIFSLLFFWININI